MTTPLFSTYSQGENRVTATFLAVLQRLSLPNMNRILGRCLASGRRIATSGPQGIESTPDAKIETGQGVWFETKTGNAVLKQIRSHMVVRGDEKLVVLTPDDGKPPVLDSTNLREGDRNRIAWASFNTLDDIVKDILEDQQTFGI